MIVKCILTCRFHFESIIPKFNNENKVTHCFSFILLPFDTGKTPQDTEKTPKIHQLKKKKITPRYMEGI